MFLYQLGQAEMLSQGGRQYQPSVGHQAGVVEDEVDAVEVVAWWHLLGALGLGSVFCFEDHYPR